MQSIGSPAGSRAERAVDDGALLLALAIAWDLLLGEPPAAVHPVVWMGRVNRRLERWAPRGGRGAQLVYGGAMALLPPAGYVLLARWLLGLAGRRRPRPVCWIVAAALLKATFAVRELRRAGEAVRRALDAGDLAGARAGLRALVSRDAAGLDAGLVAAAAVESLAENVGDSIVAPFLYYGLGGAPGALAYRAVNTLDAMVGYRGRYEWLGKGGARLDDLLNVVPARVAAGLIVGAAALAGEDAGGAWRIMRRDAGKTASPNAGWPMAAMAGALGVELEKVGQYRLGDPVAPVTAGTIARADRLVAIAAGGAALLAVGLRRATRRPGGSGR